MPDAGLQRTRQFFQDVALDVIALGEAFEVLEAQAALLRFLDLGDLALEVAQRGEAAVEKDLSLAEAADAHRRVAGPRKPRRPR